MLGLALYALCLWGPAYGVLAGLYGLVLVLGAAAARRQSAQLVLRDLDKMTLELKELERMKRDLVNGVTHDLATPLHSMRSAVNYLQAGKAGPLSGSQADYLLILSNSDRIPQSIHPEHAQRGQDRGRQGGALCPGL